jgi:BirA family biotin operon repressor/biotin-[acetyl-CoA-carboxylase] ligase
MPHGAAIWTDPRLACTRFTEVRWFTAIDSTNRYLLDAAASGVPEGLVAVADEQTAGRGRMDRVWVAPPGASLLVSVLLRPLVPPERAHLATVAAALAATAVVDDLAGITARVKWPNDVVVGDRKLAGILAESSGAAIVLGMGLNVHWETFPDDLAATATACNLCSERHLERADLLVRWLAELDRRLDALNDVVAEGARRSATLGRRVRVDLASRSFEGTATGFTNEGHLVVSCDDGRDERVTAGDVVHVRPSL